MDERSVREFGRRILRMNRSARRITRWTVW
jgi:hypothetical protein